MVLIRYQCLRTYFSELPDRHGEVDFQVSKIAATAYSVFLHVNTDGKPGSPRAIAAASKLPGFGVMGWPMKDSSLDMVGGIVWLPLPAQPALGRIPQVGISAVAQVFNLGLSYPLDTNTCLHYHGDAHRRRDSSLPPA